MWPKGHALKTPAVCDTAAGNVACTCSMKNSSIILNRNGDGNVIRGKIIFKWTYDALSAHYSNTLYTITVSTNSHKYTEIGDIQIR
jgi:hypothetical protein